MLGPISGNLDLSEAQSCLSGVASLDYAGVAVAGAGDTDGDGYDDILIGSDGNDGGGASAGAAHLLLGG